MSDSRRSKKVARMIHSEISRALLQDVADPSLSQLLVTDVDLSADLKNARVFYQKGEGAVTDKEIGAGLRRAMPYFRKRLSQNLGLRTVPVLCFEADEHSTHVARLFSLFDEVQKGYPS